MTLQMVPYNLYHTSVIINFCFNDPIISEIPAWMCFEMKTYNLLLEFEKTEIIVIFGIRAKYLTN